MMFPVEPANWTMSIATFPFGYKTWAYPFTGYSIVTSALEVSSTRASGSFEPEIAGPKISWKNSCNNDSDLSFRMPFAKYRITLVDGDPPDCTSAILHG